MIITLPYTTYKAKADFFIQEFIYITINLHQVSLISNYLSVLGILAMVDRGDSPDKELTQVKQETAIQVLNTIFT